jgi:hypothetical protein
MILTFMWMSSDAVTHSPIVRADVTKVVDLASALQRSAASHCCAQSCNEGNQMNAPFVATSPSSESVYFSSENIRNSQSF